MDRGDWWATVHRVVQSQTWLKILACMHIIILHFIYVKVLIRLSESKSQKQVQVPAYY